MAKRKLKGRSSLTPPMEWITWWSGGSRQQLSYGRRGKEGASAAERPTLPTAPGETGGRIGGFGPGSRRVTRGSQGWGGVAAQGPFRSRRPPHAKLVERLFTPLEDVTAHPGRRTGRPRLKLMAHGERQYAHPWPQA